MKIQTYILAAVFLASSSPAYAFSGGGGSVIALHPASSGHSHHSSEPQAYEVLKIENNDSKVIFSRCLVFPNASPTNCRQLQVLDPVALQNFDENLRQHNTCGALTSREFVPMFFLGIFGGAVAGGFTGLGLPVAIGLFDANISVEAGLGWIGAAALAGGVAAATLVYFSDFETCRTTVNYLLNRMYEKTIERIPPGYAIVERVSDNVWAFIDPVKR